MFARVITARTAPENVDGAVEVSRQQVSAAREQPGFRGFFLLVERQAGKLMTVSLWDTSENPQAVEAVAARVSSDVSPVIGVSGTPVVEVYEVAVQN